VTSQEVKERRPHETHNVSEGAPRLIKARNQLALSQALFIDLLMVFTVPVKKCSEAGLWCRRAELGVTGRSA
jgi:hypothetical protein